MDELSLFRDRVKNYLSTFSKSQATLAKMTGISTAALSATLSGNYKGNIQEVISKVIAVIEKEEEKSINKIKSLSFVSTTISEKVEYALDIACWDTKMLCIIGESGLGKTWAVKKYAECNQSSLLIEADPTFSVKALLENIASKLDLSGTFVRNNEILDAIVSKLKGSNRLIIIDEAEYLTDQSLDIVRRIHDKAQIPVALVGMPHLLTNVIGKKNRHAQIYSRMNLCKLQSLSVEDVRAITSEIFDSIDDAIVQCFFTLSKATTRILADLIRLTQRIMVKNNSNLSISAVKLAAETIIQVG